MPIQDFGSMNSILNNYSARDWSSSASLSDVKALDFNKLTQDLNPSAAGGKKSFAEMLTDSVAQVNNLQQEANTAIQKLATGESKNLHETMLAVEQAELAFKQMNQIRLKVIDAYKEVMRMQI
jgi:flagellar hook-basal body complex protein FliE